MECQNKRTNELNKHRSAKVKYRRKIYRAKWALKNNGHLRKYWAAKRAAWTPEQRERILKVRRAYYKKNRQACIDDSKRRIIARRKVDPQFRMTMALRTRVRDVLVRGFKSAPTMQLLGCTLPELKAHLERQFTAGMSWDNYGEWHIDHIRACATFDLLNPDEQRQCFHYTNLQSLWAADNIRKGCKTA